VDLVAAIDKIVGKRRRSAFLVEMIRDEVQRMSQRGALKVAIAHRLSLLTDNKKHFPMSELSMQPLP
jgi:hypothetical protein